MEKLKNEQWLNIAKRIQAIAQSGMAYCDNKYDIERYEELRDLSIEILAEYTDVHVEKLRDLFASETGYQTPKIDVRAVVLKNNEMLMVKEKLDNCWSLPGGWADIGYSAGEVSTKEVYEEAGLHVKPVRLLAVLDKSRYSHPPSLYYTYKIFILCEIIGGAATPGLETSDVGFFGLDRLPELSTERNTEDQIKLMFELAENDKSMTVFD